MLKKNGSTDSPMIYWLIPKAKIRIAHSLKRLVNTPMAVASIKTKEVKD